MNLTEDRIGKPTEPPPTVEDHGGGDDDPERAILVSIFEPDGSSFSARIGLPADTTLNHVSTALLSACRGAAASHSRMLAALFTDLLASEGAARAAQPAGLTVSMLDQIAATHQARNGGALPTMMELPGLANPVSFADARAILAAAGAW